MELLLLLFDCLEQWLLFFDREEQCGAVVVFRLCGAVIVVVVVR